MMKAALLFIAAVQASLPVEPLPVDAQMAVLERAVPRLRETQVQIDAELDRLGVPEPNWASSGISIAGAIESQGGSAATHVLGEWERGGNSAYVAGERPLELPAGFRRYGILRYDGPIDTHYYYRVAPGVVIHTFNSTAWVQSAGCRRRQGMELISSVPWEQWSAQTALLAFGLAEWTRDDRRTYCSLVRSVLGGGLTMVAYTPDGRPYIASLEEPEMWTLTMRAEAAARLFALESEERISD